MNPTIEALAAKMKPSFSHGAAVFLLAGLSVVPAATAATPQAFDISATEVRITAGPMRRTLRFDRGNLCSTSLRIEEQELLAEPAREMTLTVSRAQPNARPHGLTPGEGGGVDSVETFRPGQHVVPARYDDSTLGLSNRWIEPVTVEACRWADQVILAKPQLSRPAPETHRLALSARGRAVIIFYYEVYDGEPVVRKRMSVTNQGELWRRLERVMIEDLSLAPSMAGRAPLTPAGYGVEPCMVGFVSSNSTLGVIAASEIPSALRFIGTNGAMGYHPGMFEWVLGPGAEFVSEPVFLYAFSGPVQRTLSASSTPLDRTVEGPFQRFLARRLGLVGWQFPCDAPQWLTWATLGPNLDDALIRQQADLAARAGFVQFLIDDGWQRDRLGTEPNQAKFPDFSATAAYIQSRGLKLGLWLSCFRDTNSPDYRAFPDAPSRPTVTRLGGVAMSFTTPWREFFAQDLFRLHQRYGAAYFKQDFSNIIYGDVAEDHPSRTRKESLLRGLRGLLECQDHLRALAPAVMNELTHEIYWDTPGAPCDLAALKHVARYHVSPNACRGIAPRPKPGSLPGVPAVDPQKLQEELRAGCLQARQIFYAHRGLPLFCLEFYGAATESHAGSLTPEIQDRQVASWLLGAPLVFSGDLRTLSPEQVAHYAKRFALLRRLQQTYDIYHRFQFSGVPAPTDEDWHWWGKLNDDGLGAVVVVRGRGGAGRQAINIPWVNAGRRYKITALFSERNLGTFTGEQLQSAGVDLALPVWGQEILELAPPGL
ncbi:MAG: alpha-galactosidase [Verrucomicrobia bacterium]|nr:alpha-galactosidase [Verrucomicrobiota bacterium]